MILQRNKIFRGCVDIRSHEIKEAIDKNENIVVIHKGKQMLLMPEDLKKPVIVSPMIKSKIYPSQYYKLYSYKFVENKQKKLLI